MSIWWIAPMTAVLAILLTGGLRRYALSRSILDRPNERSSHTKPTPRGGGMAIAVTFCIGTGIMLALGDIWRAGAWAVLGAGICIAVVGFIDDHFRIAARWRLLAHFLAAAWALWWLGGMPPVPLLEGPVRLGWAGNVLAAVMLVWLLNLYNFMDGIDGIAGVEGVTVALAGGVLWWLAAESLDSAVAVLLAAATTGFLFWNLPVARIFMGDSGSGFLGLALGVLALWSATHAGQLLWCWLILLGVFVVDATLTLSRRVIRGERFYEAHRTHAYQHAARQLGQHRAVTLVVGGINLGWLAPIAALVATGGVNGPAALLVAYFPLVLVALHYRAGLSAKRD